jgi:CubicO group peptidase (beta-lactamase class C family)
MTMRKRSFSIVTLCLLGVGPAVPSAAQTAREPCEQITAACQGAGFTQGGVRAGTGLQLDCIAPIMQGTAQPRQARNPLPQIDPRLVADCKAGNPGFGQGRVPPAESPAPPLPASQGAAVSAAALRQFADTLAAKLEGRSVGFAFVTESSEGRIEERAGGAARRAPDGMPRAMSADDAFNIASVSKTITAAAAMKIMAARTISPDAAIAPFFPPDWRLSNSVKTITLRQLLTHLSGLRCDDKPDYQVTYEQLKQCMSVETNPDDRTRYKYQNSNFALFRILLVRMRSPGFQSPPRAPHPAYGQLYIDYVQQNLFMPIGLPQIYCKPTARYPALTDQFPGPVIPGEDFGDMTETNASRGWNMSPRQLAVFMHNLMDTEKILPRPVVEDMKQGRFGLYPARVAPGIMVYDHGGGYPGKDDNGKVFNKGELNSYMGWFSNGVSVGLIVNSQFGPNQDVGAAVHAAMHEVAGAR